MTEARRDFIAAQQRILGRCGIDAESRFVNASVVDGKAHVLITGEGPAVLMVNGIGLPAAMWAPLIAKLEGIRVFAVDLPAYGLTDGSSHFTEDLRRSAVDFLTEVLDGLELGATAILANSLGSLLTSWLALDRPERVRALVHVGCPAIVLDTSAPVPIRLLSVPLLGRLLTRIRPPSEGQVTELSRIVNEYPLSPEVADLILKTERLPDYRGTFLATVGSLIRLRGSRPAMSLTVGHLERIFQPTLVFWGERDPFGSVAVGERMVSVMPDAELQVVGGGHAPWLTQSDRIGPLASRFIQEHS